MARFNTNTFRSLNESIAYVQNPQAALEEAMEYTAALEEVILDLCEKLELDPQALVEDTMYEMAMTKGRATEHRRAIAGAKTKSDAVKAQRQRIKERDSNKIYGRGGRVRGEDISPHSGKVRAKWLDKDKTDRKYHY